VASFALQGEFAFVWAAIMTLPDARDGDAPLPRASSRRAGALATTAWRRDASLFGRRVPKKRSFLAPKSILLHHSAGGWM